MQGAAKFTERMNFKDGLVYLAPTSVGSEHTSYESRLGRGESRRAIDDTRTRKSSAAKAADQGVPAHNGNFGDCDAFVLCILHSSDCGVFLSFFDVAGVLHGHCIAFASSFQGALL